MSPEVWVQRFRWRLLARSGGTATHEGQPVVCECGTAVIVAAGSDEPAAGVTVLWRCGHEAVRPVPGWDLARQLMQEVR